MPLFQSLYSASKSLLPVLASRLSWCIFGTALLEPVPKTSFQSLPNEFLLDIFSFLELKPYIICHGVCKKWRHLLPLADMDPTRQRLLDLYHLILDTPKFQKAFKWTDQNLQPFDREAYIECLLTQYPVIPKEFRMWILEWLARLAIRSIWPALPFLSCRTFASHRNHGVNWIAHRSFSPQLFSLVYMHETPSQTFIPGLYIWAVANTRFWLIFDQNQPQLVGKVFQIESEGYSAGTAPRYPPRECGGNDVIQDSEYEDIDYNVATYEDWISYLEDEWDNQIFYAGEEYNDKDYRVVQPVRYNFDGDQYDLPAPAWDSCQRTIDRTHSPVVPIQPINQFSVDIYNANLIEIP